ncbi:HD-GYP domain-containing protein [Fusibacter paucivorans]|uniref:HD-GYP domain-containing protein n=1 Tax=Fusibacter paucivorans TaxID=76009 RepID=A0ABS5PLV9_9FIRM|nr:HD-GYP domain-containing protein [Fusibacter paucivorans]MBS7526163.1 HD-GYP domain-containing protein [Fusibacter paucivorans]
MHNLKALEASYQDVTALNDKLNQMNLELVAKHKAVMKKERRYRVLIEHMKQGIFIFEEKSGEVGGQNDFELIDMNSAMKQILSEITAITGLDNINDLQMIKEIKLLMALSKKGTKLFTDSITKRYYQIEHEHLTDREFMVCVTDKTQLYEKFENRRKQMWDLVSSMGKLVEKRDLYTAEHQKKVAALAVRIAVEMGLSSWRIESIYLASLVHDIGKISIPSEILVKPDRLAEIEYELMKTHVMSGYDILSNVHTSTPLADIVKQHHERLDGSGYPLGLKGDEMSLEAKIVAVADVFEAINSHRPYRPSLGMSFALRHLNEFKGRLYDERAVEICTELSNRTPWTLNDVEQYFENLVITSNVSPE